MPNRKKIRARARMYFFFTVMREEAFDNEELTHFPGLKLPLPSPVRGLAKNSCRGYIDSSAEAYRYRCGAWSSKPVDGREAVGRFDSYTPPPVYLKNKVKLRGASGALNFRRAQSCSPLRLQQQSAEKDQQSAGLEKAFRVEVSCRPPPPQSVLHISASLCPDRRFHASVGAASSRPARLRRAFHGRNAPARRFHTAKPGRLQMNCGCSGFAAESCR